MIRIKHRIDRKAFTLAEVLFVALVISLLVTNLLPAISLCREAARRTQCKNRLMQLGVALQSYHLTHDSFPPGCVNATNPVVNQPDGYHASWLVQLLPYVEESNLAQQRNSCLSVYAPSQSDRFTEHSIPVFSCPSEINENAIRQSNYAGVTGGLNEPIDTDNLGALMLNTCLSQHHFVDGVSQTLLLGERRITSAESTSEMTWLSGTSATLRNTAVVLNADAMASDFTPPSLVGRVATRTAGLNHWRTGGFSSHHNGGCQFCLADGSVRFLSENIDQAVYSSLGNRDDGQPLYEF